MQLMRTQPASCSTPSPDGDQMFGQAHALVLFLDFFDAKKHEAL